MRAVKLEYSSDALRARRIQLNLSQEDVAEKTGIPKSSISEFERGARPPNAVHLQKLKKALNLKKIEI